MEGFITRGECDNWWCGSRSLRIFNNFGLFAFHDRDAGVGRAEIDADDGAGRFAIAAESQTRLVTEKTVFVGDELGLDSGNLKNKFRRGGVRWLLEKN